MLVILQYENKLQASKHYESHLGHYDYLQVNQYSVFMIYSNALWIYIILEHQFMYVMTFLLYGSYLQHYDYL